MPGCVLAQTKIKVRKLIEYNHGVNVKNKSTNLQAF